MDDPLYRKFALNEGCTNDDSSHDSRSSNSDDETIEKSETLMNSALGLDAPSTGTGAKGVLRDYNQANQIKSYLKHQNEIKQWEKINTRSVALSNSRPTMDYFNEYDPELEEYRRKRMQELQAIASNLGLKHYGYLYEAFDEIEFYDIIESKENPDAFVIVHVYKSGIGKCELMNDLLQELCLKYGYAKFVRVDPRRVGLTFEDVVLPSLLIYRYGDLQNSFIHIQSYLGNDSASAFNFEELERFLVGKGVLGSHNIKAV